MALAPKPKTADGYSADKTDACEQVLVTLLGAFGTLKSTLRLVGGLVPRYLTPESHPDVPAHFGTSDVDMVLNLQLIAEGEGYASLAEQLEQRGFQRFIEPNGWSSGWRWFRHISEKEYVLVEFLQGATEDSPAGKSKNVDGEAVSALAIDHAEIVHEWYEEREVTAKLLTGGGYSIETVRYADLVAFIILKALAFDGRGEPKDAGDLIHVLRYSGDPAEVAAKFIEKILSARYPAAVEAAIQALQKRFCEGNGVEGYELNGPVAYAQFIYGKGDEFTEEKSQAQRYASGLVTEILMRIRSGVA
ncbi:hypothetical protein K9857_05980 [Pseudomonas sp. REP124]|uniref:hypothetical protein n=1 Tax=Pseudomonas sp. REP124 TaxID=2875731 RepID=UPI001CCD4F1A|nr:hypothetical protein [Pseudomonas sp. REP124]MBZ9781098.1 hypothetical protein [Pseudomonas sp. REP124]